MSKITIKLISVVLALIMSVTVVFASSYAWLVLSQSPAVNGIQVTIGGGNTILIAPNVQSVSSDGTIYNYPDSFSDTMAFNQHEEYDYLQTVGKLNPVSTINGVDWILPSYYSAMDSEVQEGVVPSGTIKDISDFSVDSELEYANIPEDQTDKIHEGHYVYLDFWVVSPGNDYKLRVSTSVDETDGGSFAIDLLEPELSDSGYVLSETDGGISASIRVGFLANDLLVTDDSMRLYSESSQYDERYSCLKGLYQEPNTGTAYLDQNRFTIYEPNGDYHSADQTIDGYYVETKPLGLIDGQIVEQRTRNNLVIQKKSVWIKTDETGETPLLDQYFQTAIYGKTDKNLSLDELADLFYDDYLQGQISPYIKKGGFIQKTGNLYAMMGTNGTVSAADLANQNYGATDDVYIIELERNVPQRIRMFIWLEGQDVDCVNSISTSRVALNIELAGGDE